MRKCGLCLTASMLLLSSAILTSCKDNGITVDPTIKDYFTVEDNKVAGFTAPLAGNTDSPEVYIVRSNASWVITPQGDYDWIKVYPSEGNLDGTFKVYVDENLTFEERTAYFAYVVDGIEQPTLMTVTQPANVPALSVADEYKCSKDGGEFKIPVTVTIPFDFEYPEATWFRVTAVGSSYVTIDVDPASAPRKGTLTLVGTGTYSDMSASIVIIQGSNLLDLPVYWAFSADLMADYKGTFTDDDNNALPANTGEGYISFHFVNSSLDTDGKEMRYVGSTGHPYVTGVFPGDYWEFKIPAPNLPQGTKIRFTGLTRPSATGQKFWRMEISDGINADSTYKFRDVPELKDTTLNGTDVQYTHEMLNASNIQIDETFELQNSVTDGYFIMRFICAANWQANGNGALSVPNGGTHRWAGTETDAPKFEVVYNPNE
jgi:hypothetical protein